MIQRKFLYLKEKMTTRQLQIIQNNKFKNPKWTNNFKQNVWMKADKTIKK